MKRDLKGLRPMTLALVASLTPALVAAQSRATAPGAAPETPSPSLWRFQALAEAAWFENPYFLGVPAGTTWSTNGRATLTREQHFRTGSFTLTGFGGTLYYPQIEELNQPVYGGLLGLDWKTGRRAKLKLSQSYERSNTRNLMLLDSGRPLSAAEPETSLSAEGLPLPTSGLESALSNLTFEQGLGQRWLLGVDGNFTWRQYEDERLADGEELNATLRLGNQVGKYSAFYFAYNYTATWFDVPAGAPEGTNPEDLRLRAHEVLVGAARKRARGVSWELAGGVGYVESTEEYYPAGRAGLRAAGRHSALAVSYERSFGQAFGYGRQMIADVVDARLSWQPGRPLTFDASYNYGYRRDPADETQTIVAWVASAGFSWEMGGGVALAARYGWERNDTEGFPVVEGARASASLSYSADWK